MTNRELLYVITIAEEKSISQAAKKMLIAQPSLSQSLQRIEETLGAPLFNRTPGGLTLTCVGERYCQTARQIIKQYSDLETEISDMNELKKGRISMGTTNHLGTLVLPRILPEFHSRYPFVELKIAEENSAVLEQKLITGQLNFAVMHAPKDKTCPQLDYEIMSRDPFLIVLSQDHPLLLKAQLTEGYPHPVLDLKFLENENFLMLHRQQRIRQVTDAVLLKAGIHHPKELLTLRNFETAQQLAAQGVGITLVPAQYASIASADLPPAFLSIDDKYDASWDLCIATLKNAFLSRADRIFMDLIRKHCASQS